MKIAKKSLSLFLSLLMVFSACSVGVFSIPAFAADSDYTKEQVKALISSVASETSTVTSGEDAWYFEGSYDAMTAVDAIFNYAINTYRAGNDAKSDNNTGETLYKSFIADFGYTNEDSNEAKLVKNVLCPDGTTVYSYSSDYSLANKHTGSWTDINSTPAEDADITNNEKAKYNEDEIKNNFTKTVTVALSDSGLNNYLLTFDSIDDIPEKITSKVRYTYTYDSQGKFATVTKVSSMVIFWITSYTHYYSSYIWNYMSSAPESKVNSVDKRSKKSLKKLAKIFTDKAVSLSIDDMLKKDAATLEKLYTEAKTNLDKLYNSGFSVEVLQKFCNYDKAKEYVDNLYFAYRVVLGLDSIDALIENVGKEYDKTDYSEMSSLYTVVNNAYNFVNSIDTQVLDYIKNEYDGYDKKYNSIDLNKSKKYINTLYDDMRLQLLKDTYSSMSSTYDKNIALVSDRDNLEDITTVELVALSQKVKGYNSVINSYSASSIKEIIPDEFLDNWNDFSSKLNAKLEVRDYETSFNSYYEYWIPLLFSNYAGLSNKEAMNMYSGFDKNLETLKTAYNDCKADIGENITDKIFTIEYNGKEQLLFDAITEDLLPSLQTNIIERNDAQLDTVKALSGLTVIDFNNYSDIKSILSHFDTDLYNFVVNHGWLTTEAETIYNNIATIKALYDAFVSTGGKSEFTSNIDADGIYANRYAGDQATTDDDGNNVQLGYPSDIARDNADENNDGVADDDYVVTKESIEQTIVKIDNFVLSEDFGSLVGLKDEDGNGTDLGNYIDELLSNTLFSDDTINMLVSLFPMIAGLLEEMLPQVIYDKCGNLKAKDPNASGRVDMAVCGPNGLTGEIDVYLNHDTYNGKQKQKNFSDVTAELGLYIYPEKMANMLYESGLLSKKDPIYLSLLAAGSDWKNSEYYNSETNTYTFEYDWGVYDYESFIDVLGAILDCIGSLLPTVFLDKNYSGTATDAGYGYGDIYYSGFSAEDQGALGDLVLDVNALNLYTAVWIPVMEALGVTSDGYKMIALTENSTGSEYAQALIEPIFVLLQQLKTAPLSKLLSILPNLVHFLSMDFVDSYLDSFSLYIEISLVIASAEGSLGAILSLIQVFTKLKFTLWNDTFSFEDLLDAKNMYQLLGFDITNLNELVSWTLKKLNLNVELPRIDQQELIFASTWTEFTSANGENSVYLVADNAQVLYEIFSYVIKCLGEPGLLEALLGDKLNDNLSALILKIADNITYNQDDALAAIMEILVPQRYELMDIDWVQPVEKSDREIENADQMSVVYLNYGNDWTREDAEYVVENSDEIVASVLKLIGKDDIESLNTYLADMVNGVFTNDVITKLVKSLAKFGDSPDATLDSILTGQFDVDITVWYDAFAYLFPGEKWKDNTTVLSPDSENYASVFTTVSAKSVDDKITWYYNDKALIDGDKTAFINILCELISEFDIVVGFLLGGQSITAFENLIELYGYETYATTFGVLLETLDVENIASQAEISANPMGGLKKTLIAVADWFDALVESDNMVETVLELIPDLFYYIESNGLSTFIHNLLMPVLVLVDDVRPILDVDINALLSLIVSEFINYKTVDINVILQFVCGVYVNDDPEYKYYSVNINKLTISELLSLADVYFGTNLCGSSLVKIGLKGICSSVEAYDSVSGVGYKTTIDAADTLTILLSALIDCLDYPAKDETKTNGDVICEFIANATGKDEIAKLYPAISSVLKGIDIEYTSPNWGYMFESNDLFDVNLPEQSIVYLGYTTDWTEDAADSVYSILDEVLELVLDSVLDDDETIATLLNGLLEDNVYTDKILNTVVELIVNLLAKLDNTLLDLIDCVVATDISTWFTFCEYDETTEKYVCKYNWGVDEAEDKKAVFVSGIKEVLEPANELLAWLFFGGSYTFFTSSATDDDGNYTYADLITLNGGEGYAYGIVPILEALGCIVEPAATFYNAETKTYNVGDAVESILDSVLALVDDISANPVEEVFNLLPNLIYFINADGLKSSVNNLLAPVDGIIEKLSPVIGDVSIGGLLEKTIGFNISDMTTETLLKFANDEGFILSDDMIAIISSLYVGKLSQFTSANGRTAYKLNITGCEGDVLTLILSIALDAFNLNADLFSKWLGADVYNAVYKLIRGASESFEYRDMNWSYMYDGEDADSQLYNNNLPERTDDMYQIYTKYQNNWNQASADYLDSVLYDLVKDLTSALRKDGSSLGQLLDNAITDGLYQDDILNSMIEAVVELLIDYEDIVKGAGVLLGAEDLATWFDDYCTVSVDENGKTVVTCTKDWGIDSATTNEAKKEAFVNGFVEALRPAYRLLGWLLFGQDYTFLNGTTNDELITITGGNGYDNALVPLLEALCCSMDYDDTYSSIKPASAYYSEDGELNVEQAVRDVFTSLTDWLSAICGDADGEGVIDVMLDILPNFIYFVNADGLKVVVNNLLVPVNHLLDGLKPFGVELDLNKLIGMDITNIDFYAVFDILEDSLGLYFPDYSQKFLAEFFIGKVVPFTSANGRLAYKMTYSESEPRRDMITCLISFVVDAFVDERNDAVLIDWLGEDIYKSIINVLNITEAKEMQQYNWLYAEFADTNKEFNATESSVRYEAAYNNIWTRDKAEYIADNLPSFISSILGLVGLEINGVEIESLDDLLDSLLEGNLYTQKTADSILDLLRDLLDEIKGLEPYGDYIVNILDTAFGVNIGVWETMTVSVVDGDRDSFVDALKEMLEPVVPLLNVLLCGEDIRLFYTIDGSNEDAITIHGSEGYAYGIIPLFEALGCTMMTPDEFATLDNDDKIGAILDSLLDRVDVIIADPVNELFAMLPELIYFINSGALDTSVNNILNCVDTVLIALEPIVGETSLMRLLGVDIAEYDFDYIINLAIEAIEDSTGLDVEKIMLDFVSEFTMGKVVSYKSANGETYCKMVYANETQMADMVTVLLRLIIDFLATGDNADVIIALIGNNSESEDAASSASTLIHFVLTALNVEPMTSGAMATLYYIFYGLNNGVIGIDKLYGNYGDSWNALVGFFEDNDESYVNKAANVLKAILKEFAGIDTDSSVDNCDCSCHNKSSIVRFFFQLANFFRRLFGMKEYRYCECGAAHW